MTEQWEKRMKALTEKLIRRIREEGRPGYAAAGSDDRHSLPAIPFRDYMADCLYDEEYGYYSSGPARVGKEGDFYTSAGIGNVMAAALARYARTLAREAGRLPELFEWGAGTGRLGLELLREWRNVDPEQAAAVRYVMAERHPGHREEARNAAKAAGLDGMVEIVTPEEAEVQLSAADFPLLVANELLDAFPVRRIKREGGVLWEIGTAYDEREERLRDVLLPLGEDDLRRLEAEGLLPAEGQQAEWGTDAAAWLERICGIAGSGRLLFIDYGDVQEELLAEYRMNGTLRCYRRHVVYDDPYRCPGDQDMTAHVNFTLIRRAAERSGWRTAYYGTQLQFLLEHGALDMLVEHSGTDPFSPEARRNRAVRQLLLSDQMSELFKVLVLERS